MKSTKNGFVDRTREKRERRKQTARALRQMLAIEPCADGGSQSYEVAFSMKLPRRKSLNNTK